VAVTPEIRTLWSKRCTSCHGADGKARVKIGEKMAIESMASPDWQRRFSDAKIKQGIVEGVSRERDGVSQKMKGYNLTPAELDGLVALIRSFR
jgi:hypothetical protein